MSEPNNNEEQESGIAGKFLRAAALAGAVILPGCVVAPEYPRGHHGGGWGGYQAPRVHTCGHDWRGYPIPCPRRW